MDEFTTMLYRLGLLSRHNSVEQVKAVSSTEIKTLFEAADKDKDGSVSFEEFVSLLPSASLLLQRRRKQNVAQNTLVETLKLASMRSLARPEDRA